MNRDQNELPINYIGDIMHTLKSMLRRMDEYISILLLCIIYSGI